MARQVKLIGSGPLAGKVFYGFVCGARDDLSLVEVALDEAARGHVPGTGNYVVIDVDSLCFSVDDGITSDILRVAESDRAFLTQAAEAVLGGWTPLSV